jgi:hypothetical protein
MTINVDVIPSTGTKYFTTNVEDSLAIADTKLRGELEEKYPEAWARISARRSFMTEELVFLYPQRFYLLVIFLPTLPPTYYRQIRL